MKKEKLIEPGSDKVIIAGKIERKIFENIQMEPIEQEQLNNLKRALINIPPLRLPKEWQDSDYLRILSYCDYEITNTIQVLKQHLLWRNNINLSNPPNFVVVYFQFHQQSQMGLFMDKLSTTFSTLSILILFSLLSIHINKLIYLFIHWHDKGFRPVIIIDINKALQVKFQLFIIKVQINQLKFSYKLKEFKNGFDYLFNMLIRDILISYYVESTIILIDLGNLNQQIHLITNELMEFVKNCEINYYGRIHKIYILEDVYKFLFNRVVQVLKPSSQDKIVFLQKKNLNQLTNQIDENQLELKFSGLQPNIQSNFWPPKDLPNVKIKKFDKKDEVKSNMSNTDENLSKSQLILQKNRPEKNKLNDSNTVSESHIIEFADSFNNLEYYPDSQFQSSKNNCQKFQDTAPLQSTTIKPRDLQRLESENWSSSDLQMSSKFITQNQKQNPCCQSSSTCQLI